ncbi:MAG: LysM peptidoglycan-binding domain-containing protein, partial [Planctomycetaceae bacterium]|nr:LysM peptidoglycan-binding domain-containing protein [Planctomycetaceae bacterium]
TNTPNPKNPFPPQQNPSPQQTAQNNQNPAPAGQNPFDANPGGAFPQARPPVQTAQANSPQTNPFDGKGGTQNPPGNASPFEQPIQTTPPPNGFNPFDGDTNLVPVKHAEKPKPNPSAQNLFPDQNPSPPQGAFPSGNGQPDGKNPFDEFKTAQKPPGDSSVVPAPKFHSPGPAEQPENKGGFNPFDNNPLPPRPPQGGFPAPQQNQNPPAQPPHQHHPTPNPNPGNGPAYDPFQQTPLAAPSQKPTRAYKVQLDETYWSISEKLYGSIRYFQALAEFNRYRIANPKHLRAGMIILVPEPEELERLYANLIPGAKKSNDPYAAHDTGFFYTKAGAPMYRVGDDDTLSTIAQNYLGRSTRWVEIYNLNKDTLKTADKVKTGMVLKLPRDASRVAIDHSYSEVR